MAVYQDLTVILLAAQRKCGDKLRLKCEPEGTYSQLQLAVPNRDHPRTRARYPVDGNVRSLLSRREETRCIIVRIPKKPTTGILLAKMRNREIRLAHS